jgi:hypothetical protein
VPTVAVLSAKSLYGAVDECVSTGFVKPEKDARTAVPQVSLAGDNRTAFVATDPLVVHVSCKAQLAVSVHCVVWASGPCSVNIPTLKRNCVASP